MNPVAILLYRNLVASIDKVFLIWQVVFPIVYIFIAGYSYSALIGDGESLILDSGTTAAELAANLRLGLGDEGCLEVAHVVGLFNYLTRMADGFGLQLDAATIAAVDGGALPPLAG